MIKITSFCALIVGLLLAMPLVFSEAEAGRTAQDLRTSVKADRLATDPLSIAFRLVPGCATDCQAETEAQ